MLRPYTLAVGESRVPATLALTLKPPPAKVWWMCRSEWLAEGRLPCARREEAVVPETERPPVLMRRDGGFGGGISGKEEVRWLLRDGRRRFDDCEMEGDCEWASACECECDGCGYAEVSKPSSSSPSVMVGEQSRPLSNDARELA